MAITKKTKVQHLSELRELISKSKIIIVWDYLGLDASEITDIRVSIRNEKATNKIYKNRLAKIAFKENNKNEIIELLTGPSSFLFMDTDESNALSELNKFIKKNDKLSFKAGYINGEFYDSKGVTEIAGLPSKDELLSMLLSALQGTIRNLAYAISQIAEKKENSESKTNNKNTEETKVETT